MTSASTASTEKMAAPPLPTLNDYSIDFNGRVVGLIRNHPTLPDGDIITTSPLADFFDNNNNNNNGGKIPKPNAGISRAAINRQYREGTTVVTESGSRYLLGRPKRWKADTGDDTTSTNKGDDNEKEGKAMDIFGIKIPQPPQLPSLLITNNNNSGGDDSDSNNDDDEDEDPTTLSLPIMDQWRIQWNGRLMGSGLNHPVYDNGDVITTSALMQTTNLEEGDTVTTYSGSQYVLGRRLDGWQKVLGSIADEATATAGVELPRVELPSVNVESPSVGNLNVGDSIKLGLTSSSSPASSSAASPAQDLRGKDDKAKIRKSTSSPEVEPSNSMPTNCNDDTSQLQIERKFRGKKNSNNSNDNNNNAASAAPAPTLRQRRREATRRYNLTGQTAGRKRSGGSNFEYLISGKPFRTTSGKSNIYTAYISNDDGLPRTTMGEGDPNESSVSSTEAHAKAVAMKVSTNCEALKRENTNYDRIIAGGCGNRFVKKYEFIDKWGGPQSPQSACALVIEAGQQDLKSVMYARGGRGEGGLDGPAMRDAALAAARSVEAMHKVDLVWTDIKPENFIVTTDSIGCDGDCPLVVKGIDLESAIPRGDTPVDYSPEASPPEFAVDFHDGRALNHVLEFTYDIWSLGMLLYELSTGRGYFDNESPEEIRRMLSSPDFKVDLQGVKRNRLRNLIGQCLQTNPKKRPSINEILLHPYFLTTGLGWY